MIPAHTIPETGEQCAELARLEAERNGGPFFNNREGHPCFGETIRVNFWAKPIPTSKFDWCAWFDNDEPNDDGQMAMGYGATSQEAIADLLDGTEE